MGPAVGLETRDGERGEGDAGEGDGDATAVGICDTELWIAPHPGQKRAPTGTSEPQCGQRAMAGILAAARGSRNPGAPPAVPSPDARARLAAPAARPGPRSNWRSP